MHILVPESGFDVGGRAAVLLAARDLSPTPEFCNSYFQQCANDTIHTAHKQHVRADDFPAFGGTQFSVEHSSPGFVDDTGRHLWSLVCDHGLAGGKFCLLSGYEYLVAGCDRKITSNCRHESIGRETFRLAL